MSRRRCAVLFVIQHACTRTHIHYIRWAIRFLKSKKINDVVADEAENAGATANNGSARRAAADGVSSETKHLRLLLEQQHEKSKLLIQLQSQLADVEQQLLESNERNVGERSSCLDWDVPSLTHKRPCSALKAANRLKALDLRAKRGDVDNVDEPIVFAKHQAVASASSSSSSFVAVFDKPPFDNAETHQLESALKHEIDRGTLLRNVLQHLVLESGLNWAADPTLRNIMLAEPTPANG